LQPLQPLQRLRGVDPGANGSRQLQAVLAGPEHDGYWTPAWRPPPQGGAGEGASPAITA